MFLTNKFVSCIFIFIFTITCNLVASDDIPVILWNIKGNALLVKPVPALGQNDEYFAETLKNLYLQKTAIVVYVVNKLSLEDFTDDKSTAMNNTLNNLERVLDEQPHVLLPTVNDPLKDIHKAHCGVQEIVVDNKIDEKILHSIYQAIQRSCVVILHIPDDGIISNDSDPKSVFLPAFENSEKTVVGMLTGGKSSWGSLNNERHTFRNLLQAAEVQPANASDPKFINYTGCIIMYADSASVRIGTIENGTVDLPFPPNLEGSSCLNESTSRILQMTFATTGPVSSVIIKFEFPLNRRSWKTVGTVNFTGGNEKVPQGVELKTGFIEAPDKYSFSCGDLVIYPVNGNIDVSVTFKRFQIQPYEVNNGVFKDSFDCVTFFTIPIWMGIIVALLFIAITNIGVYALFSVRTMDRFDDPKGKTISVAATAD